AGRGCRPFARRRTLAALGPPWIAARARQEISWSLRTRIEPERKSARAAQEHYARQERCSENPETASARTCNARAAFSAPRAAAWPNEDASRPSRPPRPRQLGAAARWWRRQCERARQI